MKKTLTLLSALCLLVFLNGCTKKETKDNWNNVKSGTKKAWKNVKQGFSEATEGLKGE